MICGKIIALVAGIVAGLLILELQTNDLAWDNDLGEFNPVHTFKREKQSLGHPDYLDAGPGGMAIWRADTLEKQGVPLVEIVLRDESVPHPTPAPHNDFLYATYRLAVPRDRIQDVLGLSDSITYDPLKQEITARCHFMGANYATLYLSTLIADGTLGLDVARNMYEPAIMQTIPSHESYNPNSEEEYKSHLAHRLRPTV